MIIYKTVVSASKTEKLGEEIIMIVFDLLKFKV